MSKKIFTILMVLSIFIGLHAFVVAKEEVEIQGGTIKTEGLEEAGYADIAKVTFAEAMDSALEECSGKILGAELEDLDGYLVYEVEVVNNEDEMIIVYVDAGNGGIVGSEPEPYKEGKKVIPGNINIKNYYPSMAKITAYEALDKALQYFPGKALEVVLKKVEGYLVYEVEIVKEGQITEVYVDAGDGDILGMDAENDEGDKTKKEN